jgi:hypothetical protein
MGGFLNVKFNLRFNNFTHWREEDLSIYFNGKKPSEAVELAAKIVILLNMTDNPLICDCNVYWMVNLVTSTHPNIIHYDPVRTYFTCGAPDNLQGKNFGYLLDHPEKLVCPVDEGCPQNCVCFDTPYYNHVDVTCDPALHSYTSLPLTVPATRLIALNLSGHGLQELDKDREYTARLQVLDVQGNKLKEIPDSFLKEATSLKTLDA